MQPPALEKLSQARMDHQVETFIKTLELGAGHPHLLGGEVVLNPNRPRVEHMPNSGFVETNTVSPPKTLFESRRRLGRPCFASILIVAKP